MMLDEQRNELRGLWRGKRKDNEEWVKGTRCAEYMIFGLQRAYGDDEVEMSKYPEFDYFEIITNTLGECAGVRDKKKVPIFEGDIVKVLKTNPKKFEGKIGIVEWVDEAASFAINLGNEAIYFTDHVISDNCEIIGNVFDNEEQIASGMMDAVLNLVNASGEDLVNVPDIVRDRTTEFGLKSSDITDNNKATRVYVIDTETTGLSPDEDEILQLSIVDESGCTVYNSLFRPERHTSWEEAEKINHITPEMTANAPTFKEMLPMINEIFSYCGIIIGYNTGFDLAFLQKAGVEFREDTKVIDVQAMFTPIAGEWDWQQNKYKWQSLVKCAEYCGYEWRGSAHDSLADALATLYCYNSLKGQGGNLYAVR